MTDPRHPDPADTTRPPAGEDGQPEDPAIVALGRAVQRALRRIDTVDKNVLQLAADVTALAANLTGDPAVGQDDDTVGGVPAVRSWLLSDDPDQACADLADLVVWVERVYLRYTRAMLSSCWLWHPEVIEELWWLRCAHADAYDPENGSWLRVGDWHDRQRTGVERRVNALLGKCDLSLHAPGRSHGQPPLAAPLAAHAAQIATSWSAGGARPTPSAPQIDEATAYLHALHRIQR